MRAALLTITVFALVVPAPPAWGDGCFFKTVGEGQAAQIAQTRQEVLLAIHDDQHIIPDNCADAVPLGNSYYHFGTTVRATNDGSAVCGSGEDSPDVWYSYTPANDGELTIAVGGWGSWRECAMSLSVHSSCPAAGGSLLACDEYRCGEGQARVALSVNAGTRYLVRVADHTGAVSTFRLEVNGPAVQEPSDEAGAAVPFVTYVVRTHYTGDPGNFVWVMPVPATPTEVVAHDTARLFRGLSEHATPHFRIADVSQRVGGCGCSGQLGQMVGEGRLVDVEAGGQAGIFDWVALASSGSEALVDWLNDNDFTIPPEAERVLDRYVQQEMHFLAVRISEPTKLAGNQDVEIPPIQFTCRTARWFYPMAVSQISAAEETEALVYVIADSVIEAANVPNGRISGEQLVYVPESQSLTNYESLFVEIISDQGPGTLITEYAGDFDARWLDDLWPDAPEEVFLLDELTRMRTVLSQEQMNLDFEFQTASDSFYPNYEVYISTGASVARLAGQPLAVLLLCGLVRFGLKQQIRRRHSRGCWSASEDTNDR